MDPDACLRRFLEACEDRDRDEAVDALIDLHDWISRDRHGGDVSKRPHGARRNRLRHRIRSTTMKHDGARYEHDCSACVFLGTYRDYDLYFCGEDYKTVIARYGDDEPEYQSGLTFVGIIPQLTEAARLAVDRGLLDPATKTGAMGSFTVAEQLDKGT